MTDIISSDRVRFGPYEVDLHTHELWKHGTRLKLVGQPFEILAVLVRRPGQLVTRDELRSQLWPGDTFVDFNHGLNAAVNKLRDALCDSAEDPKYIETLPRRGYRFIAEIESVAAPRTVQAPAQTARTPAEGYAVAAPATDGRVNYEPVGALATGIFGNYGGEAGRVAEQGEQRRRFGAAVRRYGVYSAAAVLVVGLGLWLFQVLEYRPRLGLEANEAENRSPSIFSPLTNLSDRTSDPAFSPDGSRVAFRRVSFVPGTSGIWVKKIGAEELVQVTNSADDSSPAWSPDGRSIAFSRLFDKKRAIFEVPASGGEARPLYMTTLVLDRTRIDWSPDGRTIAFTARGKQGNSAIFLLSPYENSARQLSMPQPSEEDWGPSFSPDGNQIAFWRSGRVVEMPSEGGEIRALTMEFFHVLGSPAWSADGKNIYFAGLSGNVGGLWRVPVSGGDPVRIRETAESVWNPAVSKRGFRLAVELMSTARSIDEVDVDRPGQTPRTLITSMGGENAGQQLSPDGKRMAFFSDRTGGLDIWLCDRNGQNLVQLTALGTAGSPQWSPDGREIVFDVGLERDWRAPRALFLIDADGGSPRPLLQDRFSNGRPIWSHDGRWIYFASDRSGDWQVWKIRKTGGAPVQITKEGGFAAQESSDGTYVYYSKTRFDFPEIWRVPTGGGYETPLYPGIRPHDWAAWQLLDSGIVFAGAGEGDHSVIVFYDFAKQSMSGLGILERPPFWLTSTRDGKSVIFDQPEQKESHVMLLENFR